MLVKYRTLILEYNTYFSYCSSGLIQYYNYIQDLHSESQIILIIDSHES